MVATATQEIPLTQAGKGHVPEENLDMYRLHAKQARRLDTLRTALLGQGHTEEAQTVLELSQKCWGRANALRVDL